MIADTLLDPTAANKKPDALVCAPRPQNVEGLKVGLVDNTKHNSRNLLLSISEYLKTLFNMEMRILHTKPSPRHQVDESTIRQFKAKIDFVIAGVGD
jgi:hypothetical protein